MQAEGQELYKAAGVQDDRAQSLVHWLAQSEAANKDPAPLDALPSLGKVEEGIGGFAAVFAPSFSTLQEPLWVTTTDGVGTKVLLALEHHALGGIGEDLVAMCANDLLTLGARPLGFLDYYATSHLDETDFKQVLQGIRRGLKKCSCALMGGETAQMPGLYQKKHFDLAGFMFGVVDRSEMLGAHRIEDGDLLYALPSSGFHANGFSLIRHWLKQQNTAELSPADLTSLLTPTKIYHEIPLLQNSIGTEVLHAVAHITGGGLSSNLARILPHDATAHLSFERLPISSWMKNVIQSWSKKSWQEFEGVFNLGCGMITAISSEATHRSAWLAATKKLGVANQFIGEVRLGGEPTEQRKVWFDYDA